MNFEQTVNKIRTDLGLFEEVPVFDPRNGNENASFLFLLEAPGPKAVASGVISFDNADPTARNFRTQLEEAGILREELALWNVVPWYIGKELNPKTIRSAKAGDIDNGFRYLPSVLDVMNNLQCIVLVGSAARKIHIKLSKITAARILSCHHPSARAMNANPKAGQENIDVFRFMKMTAS